MATTINMMGRSRDELLLIAERACSALVGIANQVTTEEGDADQTEAEFGIGSDEAVEFAHDHMIERARATLDSIVKEFPHASEAKARDQ